jgi:hypothetical protein
VLANVEDLRELERTLRASSPLQARALASLTDLLSDGTGPVFRGDARALRERIGEVSGSLGSPGGGR